MVMGGLTPVNLSKIGGGAEHGGRLGGPIEKVQLASNRISLEEIDSDGNPITKQRKNFVRSIQFDHREKNESQMRHASEIAPSARHRFDKR